MSICDQPWVVGSFTNEPPRDSQGNAADILLPRDAAIPLEISESHFVKLPVAKVGDRAEDVLHVRNVGPYSLISQRRLGGRLRFGGQSVTPSLVYWLHSRGLKTLAGELAGVKSDDLTDRAAVASLVQREPGSVLELSEPGAPESLAEMTIFLSALMLAVQLVVGNGHVSIGLRPARDGDVLKRSSGQVTKPETLHYQTYEDVDNGLFAPNIFGDSYWTRRHQFGHIQLVVPVISILWRLGSPSLLCATRLSDEDIERIVKHQAEILLRGGEPFLIERSKEGRPADNSNLGTGAKAIQSLLASRKNKVPVELQHVADYLTMQSLPVLPPDWRPLVLLDNGNFATSDPQ